MSPESRYILALDQGTTSSRAILFDHGGRVREMVAREFKQHYPRAGWVEHDADEIWRTQIDVACQALGNAGLEPSALAAIGITNQRETTVIWDRRSGAPIHRAIVWQDRRTAAYCDHLAGQPATRQTVRDKTGLLLDAYFSATKIRWMLDHVDGARERAEAGELAFGTIDSWLIWKLTDGRCHFTDITNASRTLLFNIHERCWDDELLALFDVPRALLPEVRGSSEILGDARVAPFDTPVPISGVAGDQQAALFGQRCTQPGSAKNTYGTGCFMIMNTGKQPIASDNKLLTTIACQVDDTVHYALEGSIFIAGAVVQWLHREFGLIASAAEIEALATSIDDNDGVYLVPAFAGLGAPHWDPHARGLLSGLTLRSGRAHLARAALEGIAYQVHDVLKAMESDAGVPIRELRVDGGASLNNFLMQFQSDIMRAPVLRPTVHETTALGAAYLAGLAVGYWRGQEEIDAQWQLDRRFEPDPDEARAGALIEGWQRALRSALAWSRD